MKSNKEMHEDFVTNTAHADPFTALICVAHVPFAFIFAKLIHKVSPPMLSNVYSFFREFFCLVSPVLLSLTIFAPHLALLSLFLLVVVDVFLLRYLGFSLDWCHFSDNQTNPLSLFKGIIQIYALCGR